MRISDWSSDVCSSDLFQRLEHAGYLKGLLQPFKGKGSLETWASQCAALRDDVIGLAQRRVLPQARAYPFSLLDVQLAQQATGAGTPFLRWRNLDRCSMGVALRSVERRVGKACVIPCRSRWSPLHKEIMSCLSRHTRNLMTY